MRDPTLDAFLPEDDADTGVGEAADEADTEADADVDGDSGITPAVEPAVSTADWTPGGAACGACGTVVEWRWRDVGRLVCEECKEW